jgi:hypothetical protein
MGNWTPPSTPDLTQDAPSYKQSANDALKTYSKWMPKLAAKELEIRTQYEPQFRQLQLQGDIDTAWKMAGANLDLQKEYGTAYTTEARKRLQEMDPEAFMAREMLGKYINDDLALGGQLSPDVAREVEQGVRGAQVSRGQVFGNAAAFQEAMARGSMSENRRQQRMANAQSFAFGSSLANESGNIRNTQAGSTPWASVQAEMWKATDPGQAWQGAAQNQGNQSSFYSSLNSSLSSIYGTNADMYLNNPYLDLAGEMGGAVLGAAGAAFAV